MVALPQIEIGLGAAFDWLGGVVEVGGLEGDRRRVRTNNRGLRRQGQQSFERFHSVGIGVAQNDVVNFCRVDFCLERF